MDVDGQCCFFRCFEAGVELPTYLTVAWQKRHRSLPPAFLDKTPRYPTTLPFSRRQCYEGLHTFIGLIDMVTATTTVSGLSKNQLPKNIKLPPENERFMRACSDIASALIQDHEAQQNSSETKRDINLNSLRGQMAKKHRLSTQPPLTAIIAAVPEHYKKYILPKLIAKPIRKPYCPWLIIV